MKIALVGATENVGTRLISERRECTIFRIDDTLRAGGHGDLRAKGVIWATSPRLTPEVYFQERAF